MLIILIFHKILHWFILVAHNENIMLIKSDEQVVAGILDALVRYIWTRDQLWGDNSKVLARPVPQGWGKFKDSKTIQGKSHWEMNPSKWCGLDMRMGKKSEVIAAETGHTNHVAMKEQQQSRW